MPRIIPAITAVAALALSATAALAHHGWSWTTGDNIRLTGVVEEARLGNPHGLLQVNAEGEIWTVEVGQPWRNSRAGLTDADLAPGTEVTVDGEPAAEISERRLKAERIEIGGRTYDLYPRPRLTPRSSPEAMEPLWAALEANPVSDWLRTGRWSYAAVNALHILGIALLVGAILPLDARRLGFFRSVPHESLARVLVPTAGAGLALAIGTGVLLFATRAGEYAAMGVFQLKMALVAAGVAVALLLHRVFGLLYERPGPRRAVHALLSAATWVTVLVLGRLIAFV